MNLRGLLIVTFAIFLMARNARAEGFPGAPPDPKRPGSSATSRPERTEQAEPDSSERDPRPAPRPLRPKVTPSAGIHLPPGGAKMRIVGPYESDNGNVTIEW